jgi:hypothetical protein
MDHKKTDDMNEEALRSLTDEQIVTERKIPRRSFLTTAGVFMGGAAAIVAGTRATTLLASPQNDPDKKKASDPDKKKASTTGTKKASDPDKKKASDPDKKKGGAPASTKATDPDKK